MADHDRPDDSHARKHDPNSVAEEVSATGQRAKGAIKEAVGDAIDDEEMENKGNRENAAGKDRQQKNDAV
ncbi:MAG: CsbD family protein [Acidobacteriota bacterium]|nr:CsbD family protein [Acidobacteriota bacterium]